MRLAVVALAGFVTGCTPMENAMVTGNFEGAMDLMRGHLGVSQRADGTRTFTYVVVANAYDGVVDKSKHEELRTEMLAGHLGKGQHCPSGYVIDKRSENKEPVHVFVYEGHCK